MERLRNSVGIWTFGPNAPRFMPGGCHPETLKESMVDRTRWAVLQWEFMCDSAAKIDDEVPQPVWQNGDAVRGQDLVYETLGLDKPYIERITAKRNRIHGRK